uniref:Uncharacterized protein n=1 Tax=Zea mays TaxID=4577 RepID=C0PME4_MAIZE|nr:unknown [Zea mays]
MATVPRIGGALPSVAPVDWTMTSSRGGGGCNNICDLRSTRQRQRPRGRLYIGGTCCWRSLRVRWGSRPTGGSRCRCPRSGVSVSSHVSVMPDRRSIER